MNIWLIIIAGGLLTFGIRFSLIYLFGRFEMPEILRGGLRLVPVAVLSALIAVELAYRADNLDLSFGNERLAAGLIAALAAWLTRNALLTIVVGFAALMLLQVLG